MLQTMRDSECDIRIFCLKVKMSYVQNVSVF